MVGPLDGVRVVECGHAVAGPFAGSLLADFGADVIKVERLGQGDSLRAMGPQVGDRGIWWSVTGRSKRSISLDLKSAAGVEILADLVAGADVLTENFRPGVMDRLGLGWSTLHARHPRLVMLSISGFGQVGPYRERGGFGKVAEAFSGATYLTGERDGSPTHPGYSLGDLSAGLMGAYGVMLGLFHRDRKGEGQYIDIALYEPLLRMIEWQFGIVAHTGTSPKRNGTQFPFGGAFLTDICDTADGESVVVSAATTESVSRLRVLLVNAGYLDEPTGGTDEPLERALRAWVASLTRDEVLSRLEETRLVGGPVLSAADLMADPHARARGNFQTVLEPTSGVEYVMPAVTPFMSATPGAVRWVGPELGEHTEEILRGELAYDDERIQRLMDEGIVR